MRVVVPADGAGPAWASLASSSRRVKMRTWPPGDVVVVVGQRASRSARAASAGTVTAAAARPQHPGDLGHRRAGRPGCARAPRRRSPCRTRRRERHRGGVAGHRAGAARRRASRRPRAWPRTSPPPGELGRVRVQGHHAGAAAQRLEGVPPAAAAQVEHPVARADREPARSPRSARRPPAGRLPPLRRCAHAPGAGTGRTGRPRATARPGEPLLHPLPARRRPAAPARPGSRAARAARPPAPRASPGSTSSAASPVTSGSAPVRLATSGRPRRHVLHRGQREPLVQRGHHGDLGAGAAARPARCR